jgi:hypothetical protein
MTSPKRAGKTSVFSGKVKRIKEDFPCGNFVKMLLPPVSYIFNFPEKTSVFQAHN